MPISLGLGAFSGNWFYELVRLGGMPLVTCVSFQLNTWAYRQGSGRGFWGQPVQAYQAK